MKTKKLLNGRSHSKGMKIRWCKSLQSWVIVIFRAKGPGPRNALVAKTPWEYILIAQEAIFQNRPRKFMGKKYCVPGPRNLFLRSKNEPSK